MDWTLVYLVLSGVLVVVGLTGLMIPVIPGAPMVFGGLLLAAWAEDFFYVGQGTLWILAGLAALTWVVELLTTIWGAKRFGASNRAAMGAVVGAVGGLFLGLPGVLLGPFVGAVAAELSLGRELRDAGRAGLGAVLGLAVASALKLALVLAMVGIFLLDRFVWGVPF
jgi:hypothetical protein